MRRRKTLEEKQAWMLEQQALLRELRRKVNGVQPRQQQLADKTIMPPLALPEYGPFAERTLRDIEEALDQLYDHVNKHHQKLTEPEIERLRRSQGLLAEVLRDAEQKNAFHSRQEPPVSGLEALRPDDDFHAAYRKLEERMK